MGRDSGFWVELGLILVTQLRISCKATYLILVERRTALSPRRRLINTELGKQIDRVLYLPMFIVWIIASSSLSSLYLVASFACPTHQFIIGVSF